MAGQAQQAQATMELPGKETEAMRRTIVEPPSAVMNISMDGAMVNIRDEGWKEVKTVAVSALRHTPDALTGKVTTWLTDHSYRAGLWDASEFCQQQWAEACRRGVEKAEYLSSVNDGAAWIWNIVRICYGNCVEILDWWHAVAKLWLLAQHQFGGRNSRGDSMGLCAKTAVNRGEPPPTCAQHPPALPPRKGPTRLCAQRNSLSLPQSQTDALPALPRSRLPHRQRHCRVSLQTGRSTTPQTGWHALVSTWRSSHARTSG